MSSEVWGLLAHIPKSEISTSHRSLFLVETKGIHYNHNEPSLIYSFYDSKMMYVLSLYIRVCVCVCVCVWNLGGRKARGKMAFQLSSCLIVLLLSAKHMSLCYECNTDLLKGNTKTNLFDSGSNKNCDILFQGKLTEQGFFYAM